MNNNLKYILNEMYLLKKEEAKINYYFEPTYKKINKIWKRHMNFLELKQDFIQDITNYGFSPYLPKTFKEQKDNKNIMRFCKSQNYGYQGYIKKIYKLSKDKEISKKDSNKEKKIIFFKRLLNSNKNKNEIIKRIIMKNGDNDNPFLRKIYSLYEKEKNKNNKINKNKKQKELTKTKFIKNKILTPDKEIQIVNFSGCYTVKTNKFDENKTLKDNSSFIYESIFNTNNNFKFQTRILNENTGFRFKKKILLKGLKK